MNAIDRARLVLEQDLARAAVAHQKAEDDLALLKLQVSDAGHAVIAARVDQRAAVRALETHDANRSRGARS